MWRGRPPPRTAKVLTEASREPRWLPIRTTATLIPSADVPLITPATIISFFVMPAAAAHSWPDLPLRDPPQREHSPHEPELPAALALRIPIASAKASQPLRRTELSFSAEASPISS